LNFQSKPEVIFVFAGKDFVSGFVLRRVLYTHFLVNTFLRLSSNQLI